MTNSLLTIGAQGAASLGLNAREQKWVDYIRNNVVSRLPGSTSQRAHTAAVVTWWALKEGVLDLPNPWRHNLCSGQGGDSQIGDLAVCGGGAWQIGMSGIQGTAVSLARAEQVANQLYPGKSISSVLASIASDANVDSATKGAVEASTGTLRKAWLLRDPAISFVLQEPFVKAGCLTGSASWCFGSWNPAKRYASSKSRTQEVIAALESHYESAPSSGGSTFNKALWAVAIGGAGLLLYSHLYGAPAWFPKSVKGLMK